MGHIARNCLKKKKEQESDSDSDSDADEKRKKRRGTANKATDKKKTSRDSSSSGKKKTMMVRMKKVHMARDTVLDVREKNDEEKQFLIDSGASSHMSSS